MKKKSFVNSPAFRIAFCAVIAALEVVLMMAAVAAETGLPVMPNEAAMVATVMGRSGRIFEFLAISEMIGSSE